MLDEGEGRMGENDRDGRGQRLVTLAENHQKARPSTNEVVVSLWWWWWL
jgi:hypothetical protein